MSPRRVMIVSTFAALVIVLLTVGGIAFSQARAPAAVEAGVTEAAVEPGPASTGSSAVTEATTADPFVAQPKAAPGMPPRGGPGVSSPRADYGTGIRVYPGGGVAGPFARTRQDPEMTKLLEADSKMEQQTRDLVGQYQKAENEKERAALRSELEKLCNEHFDVRQKRRQLEVTRLEERLEQIRQAIEKRNEARELIVRVRVSQLVGDVEWDDWALPGRTRGPEVGLPTLIRTFPTAPSGLPPESTSPFSPRRPSPAVPRPAPPAPR